MMGLILPFRGYVPRKGTGPTRTDDNSRWNKKAIDQINLFKSQLERLDVQEMAASYASGAMVRPGNIWLTDIVLEDDVDQKPLLNAMLHEEEYGSIVVINLSDIYHVTTRDSNERIVANLSTLRRINSNVTPVISIGSGAASLTNKLKSIIDRGVAANREGIRQAIFSNYIPNMKKIDSRIAQF